MQKKEGLLHQLLIPLDERVYPVKLLLRVWGPRLEFFVRLILVATFLDDSFRTAMHFSEHTKQVGEEGCLQGMAEASPELVNTLATVALAIGLLAQSLGSVCLLALLAPHGAITALIGWAVAQPVLYAQLTNVEFVARSLSLTGGLLLLRAHIVSEQAKRDPISAGGQGAPNGADRATIARTQLLGRLMLPSVYLYHAGLLLLSIFVQTFSMFVVNTAVLVGLAIGCALIAAGLKSRTVALSLAVANIIYLCYQHPFFRFVWFEGGEWIYDETELRKSMPHVALPADVSPQDFELWQIYDLHRYYFFQRLSTSGALLLLAQFGPGEIAVEEDESLLPLVQRAQD